MTARGRALDASGAEGLELQGEGRSHACLSEAIAGGDIVATIQSEQDRIIRA